MEISRTNVHNHYLYNYNQDIFSLSNVPKRRVKREEQDPRCEKFLFDSKDQKYISHPYGTESKNNYYYSGLDCVTVISGAEGTVVELTFIDMFHVEYHPECKYDYLEIRDGLRGYAKLLDKVCGEAFPRQIRSTGPNVWLKFHSDDTIEYEGFRISINFIQMSTSVTTKGAEGSKSGVDDNGNIMYIRLYVSKAGRGSLFNATYTAYRSLDPNKDDNTCIDINLKCDGIAHCRLKGDEENDDCKGEKVSTIKQTHILVILIIFSLILSGMSFVFLFKCIRKLYQDHKIIKPISIDSDYIQETRLEDEEPWRREVEAVHDVEDVKIERNGKRRSDVSRREESIRSKKREEKKEIRDVLNQHISQVQSLAKKIDCSKSTLKKLCLTFK
ncbi:unnamed protein product [Leptidea sinapis]|uniref:CUB domain-containing protein n=1 Tax=Leptidea sinapis TaxID=189913 RepID=A0A5E4PKE0_9NEOP|nr:unnamed protein product [Leptidea sinapis]